MESMPASCEATILKGIWFVFPVEGCTIRAWGSAGSGLERVYLDDTIVSERRSAGRVSIHTFEFAGQTYDIEFRVRSMLRAHLECMLRKNGTVIKAYAAKYGSALGVRRILALVVGGAAVGFTVPFFTNQLWVAPAVVAIVLLVIRFSRAWRDRSRFTFEEISPTTIEN